MQSPELMKSFMDKIPYEKCYVYLQNILQNFYQGDILLFLFAFICQAYPSYPSW